VARFAHQSDDCTANGIALDPDAEKAAAYLRQTGRTVDWRIAAEAHDWAAWRIWNCSWLACSDDGNWHPFAAGFRPFIAETLPPVRYLSEGRKRPHILEAHAMHISEGFLPLSHAAAWAAASAPFLVHGVARLNAMRDRRYLLAASAGYLFTLTALKLPSVAGSSSHPTGVALGAVLSGPAVMPALSLIVLLFQALLTAHGGLTTLGANVFSLGVAGPWTTWLLWRLAARCGLGDKPAVVLATAIGSLATYGCTSLQLALAHPDPNGGVAAAFLKFAAVFSVTQLPVAVIEAVFTVAVMRAIANAGGGRLAGLEAWAQR
jgi:cobalt/nickel transport system permease protein